MAKSRSGTCDCGKTTDPVTFDAEQAIQNLSRQFRELADTMTQSIPTGDQRSERLRQKLLRIIGGQAVQPGAFPECSLIGDVTAQGMLRTWYCTGSLIHPRAVLTARHCIGNASVGSPEPNAVAIELDKQSEVEATDIVRVSRIVPHPTEDVALLILRAPSKVTPVALATTAQIAKADQTNLVGFGNSNPNGTIGFGTKREVAVEMQVVRRKDSDDLTQEESVLGFNSVTEFVAGRKGSGQDSCNGDSGGPAYIDVGGSRRLAGVTSRATDEAMDNCGDGGIYVRVDALDDWIRETIKHVLGN